MNAQEARHLVSLLISEEAKQRTVTHLESFAAHDDRHNDPAYARLYFHTLRLELECELAALWYSYEKMKKAAKVQRRYIARMGNVERPVMTLAGNVLEPTHLHSSTVTATHVSEFTTQAQRGNYKHCVMLGQEFGELFKVNYARFLAFLEVRECRRHQYQFNTPATISYIFDTTKQNTKKLRTRVSRVERSQLDDHTRKSSDLSGGTYDGFSHLFNEVTDSDTGYRAVIARGGINEFQPVSITRETFTDVEAEAWANAQYND